MVKKIHYQLYNIEQSQKDKNIQRGKKNGYK